ncbi:MAG: hypothetical protein LBT03_00560 [Holosporales bacterium]|jgi:hypothetical protein|nr:hypothetical protein [Holosporales bacterium]
MRIHQILTILLFVLLYDFSEATTIVPGIASQDLSNLENYDPPYKRQNTIGFITNDRRPQTITANLNVSATCPPVEKLCISSENHWIALWRRDLKSASSIANEMARILLGRDRIYAVMLEAPIASKYRELKFRCIEQIAISNWGTRSFNLRSFASTGQPADLYRRNFEEFESLYYLAQMVTCAPILFQIVSYDILTSQNLAIANRAEVERALGQEVALANSLIEVVITKHPANRDLITATYSAKKNSFARYIQHIYAVLQAEDMRNYLAVDRGQSSGSHRNTCMFNSIFSVDVSKGNIPSTKIGSINKAKEYLQSLSVLFNGIATANDSPLYNPSKIKATLDKIARSNTAEAVYSFVGDIFNNSIYQEMLSDGSATEIQCHALSMNLIIFPKTKVRQTGDKLLNYFGTSYFGSENFPIAAVSCSTGHAQSLVKK